MTPAALIDTNILSALMQGRPEIRQPVRAYIEEHAQLAFFAVTYYEIQRGLLTRNSSRKRAVFEQLCVKSRIFPIDQAVLDEAARLYAYLHVQGQLIGDADIFIAATAVINGYRLITDNVRHFARIPNLTVENWLTP